MFDGWNMHGWNWSSDSSLLIHTKSRFYYNYSNKKKEDLLRAQPDLAADPMVAFMDITDRENPAFKYSL